MEPKCDITDLLHLSPVMSQSTRVIAGRLQIGYCKILGQKSPFSHEYDPETKILTILVIPDPRYRLGSACDVEMIELPSDMQRLEARYSNY